MLETPLTVTANKKGEHRVFEKNADKPLSEREIAACYNKLAEEYMLLLAAYKGQKTEGMICPHCAYELVTTTQNLAPVLESTPGKTREDRVFDAINATLANGDNNSIDIQLIINRVDHVIKMVNKK